MRLFRGIVLDVWQQREAANLANAGALQEQADEINRKSEQLSGTNVFQPNRIDPETYTRMRDKLQQDLMLVQVEQRKSEVDGFNIEPD